TNIVLHWIADGMKQEPKDMITRIGYLFNGSIEEALRRSAVSSAGADVVRAGQQVEDAGSAGHEQHGAENAGAMPPGQRAAEDAGTPWP
ncbi:MAG: TetR family transcriptional regulator C-terminal domain-containing protein, partial [Lachnospiraceae bacterium]|nr:TetR family transcriptional regulator C-terminal domain-containing protein [Lachnospiraceae bacterium]